MPPKQRRNNLSITCGVCFWQGAKRKKCSHKGCTNMCYKGGVCRRHGRKCNHEGCTNVSVKGGVCVQHGAKVKVCSFNGCTGNSQKGGVCRRHGAKINNCNYEGCSNLSKCSGGVCLRHSAKANKKICRSSEYNIEEHTLADRQNNNIQASIVIIVCTTRVKRIFFESNPNIVSASMTFSKRKKCLTKGNYSTNFLYSREAISKKGNVARS